MKIGAITNHISEDLQHSLSVLRELGLTYAEFCGAWNVSAGCHDEAQTEEIVRLFSHRCRSITCQFFRLRWRTLVIRRTLRSSGAPSHSPSGLGRNSYARCPFSGRLSFSE